MQSDVGLRCCTYSLVARPVRAVGHRQLPQQVHTDSFESAAAGDADALSRGTFSERARTSLVNGAVELSQVVAEQAQVCHTPSALQLHRTHRHFLRWAASVRAGSRCAVRWTSLIMARGRGEERAGARSAGAPTRRRRFAACALAVTLLLLVGMPPPSPPCERVGHALC
jgi:hypothetical protein